MFMRERGSSGYEMSWVVAFFVIVLFVGLLHLCYALGWFTLGLDSLPGVVCRFWWMFAALLAVWGCFGWLRFISMV